MSVRMTRSGRTVDRLRDDRAGDRRAQVDLLDVLGHPTVARQQEARAHGDAIGAHRERHREPTSVEDAAGRDHGDVDRIEHLGDEDRRRHDAGVATALGALGDDGVDAPRGDLLGVATRPMVGMTTTPASFSFFTTASPGACAKEATRTLALMRWSTRASMSMASVRRLTPNGASVAARTSSIACTHLLERHRRRRDDAETAGVGRRRSELRVGHPPHAGLDDRITDAEQRRSARVCSRGSGVEGEGRAHLNSALRAPLGSMTSRRVRSSSAVGGRDSGTSPSITSSNVVASTIWSTVTPG